MSAHARTLQFSGYSQPHGFPLSLTKLVMQPAASNHPLDAAVQYSDISSCVRHLSSLRHLAVYWVDLQLQSEALFTAASSLPHLRSLHLVRMHTSMWRTPVSCSTAVQVHGSQAQGPAIDASCPCCA
jgi:hypothetical protein